MQAGCSHSHTLEIQTECNTAGGRSQLKLIKSELVLLSQNMAFLYQLSHISSSDLSRPMGGEGLYQVDTVQPGQ